MRNCYRIKFETETQMNLNLGWYSKNARQNQSTKKSKLIKVKIKSRKYQYLGIHDKVWTRQKQSAWSSFCTKKQIHKFKKLVQKEKKISEVLKLKKKIIQFNLREMKEIDEELLRERTEELKDIDIAEATISSTLSAREREREAFLGDRQCCQADIG